MKVIDVEAILISGFISLPDEDGEQNYIPVTNIDCLETARVFIYFDEAWEEMERRREIENNKNWAFVITIFKSKSD